MPQRRNLGGNNEIHPKSTSPGHEQVWNEKYASNIKMQLTVYSPLSNPISAIVALL